MANKSVLYSIDPQWLCSSVRLIRSGPAGTKLLLQGSSMLNPYRRGDGAASSSAPYEHLRPEEKP